MNIKVGDTVFYKNTEYTIRKIDEFSIYLITANGNKSTIKKELSNLLKKK